MKKPTERSGRQRKSLKTVEKSSKQRYALIVKKSLFLQAIDRFSAQRNVTIRQGKTKRKPTERKKKEIIIIVSVAVLCVAVFKKSLSCECNRSGYNETLTLTDKLHRGINILPPNNFEVLSVSDVTKM